MRKKKISSTSIRRRICGRALRSKFYERVALRRLSTGGRSALDLLLHPMPPSESPDGKEAPPNGLDRRAFLIAIVTTTLASARTALGDANAPKIRQKTPLPNIFPDYFRNLRATLSPDKRSLTLTCASLQGKTNDATIVVRDLGAGVLGVSVDTAVNETTRVRPVHYSFTYSMGQSTLPDLKQMKAVVNNNFIVVEVPSGKGEENKEQRLLLRVQFGDNELTHFPAEAVLGLVKSITQNPDVNSHAFGSITHDVGNPTQQGPSLFIMLNRQEAMKQ